MRWLLGIAVLGCGSGIAHGQEAVRLVETFLPGQQYRVSCRVSLEGSLRLPADKAKDPQSLRIAGKSVIEYQERVLAATQNKVERTVRRLQQMDFTRTVGDAEQESKLRQNVNLLVILRHKNLEVPFSPLGPLLWNEIDLVRTDVFTPALAGLLPRGVVRPGDRWNADEAAAKELTDLESLDKGALACRFEGTDPVQRRLARVSFQGTLRGIGEDGPAEHQLDGFFYFDLETNHLSYLSLEGRHRPLDKAGLPQGDIRGTFVLTRDTSSRSAELTDEGLRQWNLEPSDQNTLLLYQSAEARFLYPRHWRVASVEGRQITLEERGGGGLLITLDTTAKLPNAQQFQQEMTAWLAQQKGRVVKLHSMQGVQANPYPIDRFTLDAQIGNQPYLLDNYLVRQSGGGATISGRYLPAAAAQLQKDVERLAKSLVIAVK